MTIAEELLAARTALEGGDLDLALAIWGAIRHSQPLNPVAYTDAASALVQARRTDEADHLLSGGPIRLLSDREFFLHWASVAHSNAEYDTAILRWEMFQAAFPDSIESYLGIAGSLSCKGNLYAAEKILGIAIGQFPDSVEPMIEYALLAAKQSNWGECIRRWAVAREKFADEPRAYIGGAEALQSSGRHGEAEAILSEAVEKLPDDLSLRIASAQFAEASGNWGLAASRWASALVRDPNNDWIAHRIQITLIDTQHGSESADIGQLLSCFESLGSSQMGSEFGLVQRHHGIDPPGLLRWSDVLPDRLCEALDMNFEGVGLPENTKLGRVTHGKATEYMIVDTRYGIRTRSFVSVKAVEPDAMLRSWSAQVQLLRDKFLGDLSSGRKILIYKADGIEMADFEVKQLHRSLSRYGRNILLCVRHSDIAHPDGAIEQVHSQLMIGYIRNLLDPRGRAKLEQPSPTWVPLCRTAIRMQQAANLIS